LPLNSSVYKGSIEMIFRMNKFIACEVLPLDFAAVDPPHLVQTLPNVEKARP
jgi:hypothetical protein